MSQEDINRLLGAIEAHVEMLKKRVGRLETGIIMVGAGALGVVVTLILRQAGLL